MATPPFQVEDQTDEDFFDKLVDDEFGITQSHSGLPESLDSDEANFEPPVKSLLNRSLNEAGGSFEDSGGGTLDSEKNGRFGALIDHVEAPTHIESLLETLPEVPEKDILVEEKSISLISPNLVALDTVVGTSDSAKADLKLDSKTGKSSSCTGISVKEVQWSCFNSDTANYPAGAFGSFSDFFSELGGDVADKCGKQSGDFSQACQLNTDPILIKNQVFDAKSLSSSEHQDEPSIFGTNLSGAYENPQEPQSYSYKAEQEGANDRENQACDTHNDQTTNEQSVYDSQYWENLYPGWRYDPDTGEWHQLEGYGTAASGSYTLQSNKQESCQDKEQSLTGSDDVFSGQRSEISYLQQTAQSVLGTVAEECMTGSVSNWNELSQGSTEYPHNMVFDPQYPGWYYNTITQEWCMLETYHQAVRTGDASTESTSDNVVHVPQGVIGSSGGVFANKDFGFCLQDQGGDWTGSASGYADGTNQALPSFTERNMWYSERTANSGATSNYSGNHQSSGEFHLPGNLYNPSESVKNYADQQTGFKDLDTVSLYGQKDHNYDNNKGFRVFQSIAPADNSYLFNQPKAQQNQQTHFGHDYCDNQKPLDYSQQPFRTGNSSNSQFCYSMAGGRTSAGRPPHPLVTFGFGGKLVVMKGNNSFWPNSTYGSQDFIGGSISILNLVDIVEDKSDSASIGSLRCDYIFSLCRQSFPGPLVGGNVASKELNKWLDERIANCESSNADFRKGELVRLLLSLLKISYQHYGKLRSPFGIDLASQEIDGLELAVTKLFASAKRNGAQSSEYGALTHCLQSFPSEVKIRTAAVEVQNLLVSGRRREALQCAQEAQLWGPALVLAAQLGEKFYVDTVKQMAHRQFVSGSPLRTLCLLIAGQPADVFSSDSSSSSSFSGSVNVSQHPSQVCGNGMLDDWEENLAIITANRTKDDELVIIHLGDCLWKERGEVTAAHTCYLVAEANFESFSDSARLCLVGADHWKCPRTYASPEAIQRTELYEYAKVLGNSQYILLPFQPYKLIYAHMLAEVGKVSDSLKYCQAISKSLKNAGRTAEVESWKNLLSSLEERIRTHQQGGYSSNLAPAKLVGKIFTSLDSTIHRIIGAPPAPLPPLPPSNTQNPEFDSHSAVMKNVNNSSMMAIPSLMPSASMEPISEWTGDNNRMTVPNRSISEPDFGRGPRQGLKEGGSTESQGKVPGGPSRFSRIGSQILQKTIGWVSRSHADHQAKLGEKNKFYYDEKLKRWVEEGAELPAEEAALPPPPTTATFQNGTLDYNIKTGFKVQTGPANGGPETNSPIPAEPSSSRIPPIPPSTNQFSARGRMGVRSRYVDTFNKGGGTPKNLFQSPTVPAAKPGGGAKFFIPTPTASDDQTQSARESNQEALTNEDPSSSSPSPSSLLLSSSSMHRYSSMDNLAPVGNKGMSVLKNGNAPLSLHSRAASWSGSLTDSNMANLKTMGIPSSSSPPLPINGGGSFGDDLHEVEL